MRPTLLEIPLDPLTRAQAGERVLQMLAEPRGHFITTPNPEMLVAAHKDPAFKKALQKADLALPDGFGLVFVGTLLGKKITRRIPGIDLINDLAQIAAQKNARMYLLGGEGEGTAERAAKALQEKHPGLQIAGAENGGPVTWGDDGIPRAASEVLARIQQAQPDILLVALGHKKQEEWIVAHLPELPSVRIAIGVGGAFDFLAGDIRRAPAIFRTSYLGLEWLWRLALEPRKRLKRIWTAVVVFPLLALTLAFKAEKR